MSRVAAGIIGAVCCLGMLPGCATHAGEIITGEKRGITLTVLAGQSTSDAGVEDMINEIIAKKMPGVELEWQCVDWGDQFASQMLGRFVAGDIPDMMVGKAQDVAVYAPSGNLAPIPADCLSNIRDNSLETVRYHGVAFGLPYNAWYQGVLFNKDIFSENKLPVPNTQEELDYAVKRLEAAGITPFASHFYESWKAANMTMQFFVNDIFKKYPDWGDQFRQSKTGYWGNKAVEQCYRYSTYVQRHSWDDALVIDQHESDLRFSRGEAAMYMTGSWSLQVLSQVDAPFSVGIFPYPNQTGDASLIVETNMTFFKSAKTAYPEQVDTVLRELASDRELAAGIAEFTQALSALKNVESEHNPIQPDVAKYEQWGRVVDASIGNSQLVWEFQNDVAVKQLEWMQGKITLDELLAYADLHRPDSMEF